MIFIKSDTCKNKESEKSKRSLFSLDHNFGIGSTTGLFKYPFFGYARPMFLLHYRHISTDFNLLGQTVPAATGKTTGLSIQNKLFTLLFSETHLGCGYVVHEKTPRRLELVQKAQKL